MTIIVTITINDNDNNSYMCLRCKSKYYYLRCDISTDIEYLDSDMHHKQQAQTYLHGKGLHQT